MRSLLFVVILTVISLQSAEAKANIYSKSLAVQRDARELSDIWNNIKNSATNAWNSIKNIVKSTKDKVKEWIGHVQNRARSAKETMLAHIKEVREKSEIALQKLLGTGQLVKDCLQQENEALEALLKQIVEYVTTCIADSLNNLSLLEKLGFRLDFNETNFIDNVEDKMNKCIINKDDAEECLNNVRQEIYSSMDIMENEVLKHRTEARGVIDDLLVAIVNCSIKGLIDASNTIANESIEIINCVVQG